MATRIERTAIYFIVNTRENRYKIITSTNTFIPTVNYLVENYEL